MRILIVTQYFWPENFRINDLALGLKERGHSVEVLTGKPNYGKETFYDGYTFWNKRSEMWNGIQIKRASLIPRLKGGSINLALNYFSFAILGALKALFISSKYDKIFVYAPSPITVGIPAIVMKWRCKAQIYFWVQDLWPESVTATTGIKNRFLLTFLNSLTTRIYKKSDKILIQSEAFRESIIDHKIKNEKIVFYPNTVESFFNIIEQKAEFSDQLPKGFRIMFAGNIGEAQDFDTLLTAAVIVSKQNSDIKWIILGNGRKKKYVQKKISAYGLNDVFFLLGGRSLNLMPDYFACADCLLVSLKKEYIFSLTIPSKIQSYLACGKPIIAALDGEGGRIVREAKSGLVSQGEDTNELAENVLKMFNMDVAEREQMGLNGRKYFEKQFERELLLTKLEAILL